MAKRELIDRNNLESTTIATDDYSGNEVVDVVLMEDVKEAPVIAEQDIVKPVLDKIRAEIIDTGAYEQETKGHTEFLEGINYCLGVINKYKAESEVKADENEK